MLLKRILTAGAALLLVSACSSAEEVAPARADDIDMSGCSARLLDAVAAALDGV